MAKRTKSDIEVVAHPEQPTLAPLSGPTNLIELAIQNGANIDTIERLMALYEREQAKKAFRAFHDALSGFQSVVPPIKRNKKGYDGKYTYAELDKIITVIQKPLRDWGFTYRYEFRDVPKDKTVDMDKIIEAVRKHDFDKKKLSEFERVLREILSEKDIEVTCIITHKEGHSETTKMVGPEDFSGFKNSIQSRGSSTTYLERYSLIGALGLVTVDEDNDGGKPKPEVNDKRDTASGQRWEHIKNKVQSGEVSLETAEKHYRFSEEQQKELRELVIKKPEQNVPLSDPSPTVIVPDQETFRVICKDVMSGKVAIKDITLYSFTEDQLKSLELMEKQAQKKV